MPVLPICSDVRNSRSGVRVFRAGVRKFRSDVRVFRADVRRIRSGARVVGSGVRKLRSGARLFGTSEQIAPKLWRVYRACNKEQVERKRKSSFIKRKRIVV